MSFETRAVLSDWQEGWITDFAELAELLRTPLDGIALRIDHIGSTSVPGLRAKDVIDVQVIVAKLETDRIREAFEGVEFEQRTTPWNLRDHIPAGWGGDPESWQKLVFAPPDTYRPSNIHVRVGGAPNERYALLFRDFLRAHDDVREMWSQFKTQLAAVAPTLSDYGATKDPATDVLIALAERWAADVGWSVPEE